MSYCRWSSNNWKSDVYCYEDCMGGWTTHVAQNRIVSELPQQLPIDNPNWFKRHQEILAALETAEREPIGLKFDSQTFNDPDLHSFKERLKALAGLGYQVPHYVFEVIDEEINAYSNP